MSPILLYPQNASQVKFFKETAQKEGVEMVRLPKKVWEDINEKLYAERLVSIRREAKFVSEEKLQATFDRILGRK